MYKVCSNGEHRPLGMFVGIVNMVDIFGENFRYNQALILDQALRDIETNYKDDIREIQVVG